MPFMYFMVKNNLNSCGKVAVALLCAFACGCAACRTPSRSSKFTENRRLAEVTFAAVDIETTGFSPQNDRIIEIACVKFRNGRILEQRSWLVNPGIPIAGPALRVHGITSEMVKDSPRFKDIAGQLRIFVGDAVVVMHNAAFDTRFLSNEFLLSGMEWPDNLVLDSLTLCRKWFPEAKAHDLESIARHLGLEEGVGHRALADARCLFLVFTCGVGRLPAEATLRELTSIPNAGRTLRQ